MGASFTCIEGRRHERSRKAVEAAFEKRYGRPRPQIEHVVVLMLENRTFDNVFGAWMHERMKSGEVKPSRWDVHAQAGKGLYDYTNVVVPSDDPDGAGTAFPVWSRDPRREDVMSQAALGVPNGDPAEKFELLNRCLYEDGDPGPDDEVTLGGFAQEYYEREMHDAEELGDVWADRTDFESRRSPAMHVFRPEQMRVFTELADNFGVSDTYFASAPCQTWPNRLFAANGHCYGYVNNLSDHGEAYDHDKMNAVETMMRTMQFDNETMFDRLLHNNVEWGMFYGDFPLAVMLNKRLQTPGSLERTYPYRDFAGFCKEGLLPPFTWIEPQYLKSKLDGSPPNDMHPPHNVLYGQQLVADVYNSLRGNEALWKKTLFLVTCDEGVGIFDHVPPPAAPDPKKGNWHRFYGQEPPHKLGANPFERYGTRVPCLIASPFLDVGSVVRPDKKLSAYPFDHASIMRTVFDLFVDPHCHLTNRDKLAPSLAPYLRERPREDLGVKSVSIGAPPPLVDHGAARPGNPGRGGCHSVDFLMNSAAKMQDDSAALITSAAKTVDRLSNLTVDKTVDLATTSFLSVTSMAKSAADEANNQLPGMEAFQEVMEHFQMATPGKLPHWVRDGNEEEESEAGSSEAEESEEEEVPRHFKAATPCY